MRRRLCSEVADASVLIYEVLWLFLVRSLGRMFLQIIAHQIHLYFYRH